MRDANSLDHARAMRNQMPEPHLRLWLELHVDGDRHSGRESSDATRFLEEQGYRVVRFSNPDVMAIMDGVLVRLGRIVDDLRLPPLPTLSPEGERALSGETRSPTPERGEGFRTRDNLPLPFRGEGRGEGHA